MPVASSGVMFGVMIAPNGVCSARPPANGLPPGAVWQAMQSPIVASALPRCDIDVIVLLGASRTAPAPQSQTGRTLSDRSS